MNKLLLLSSELTENHLDELLILTGKNVVDLKILLIENAADLYAEEKKGFVYFTRENLEKYGLKYNILDLREYFGKTEDLKEKIKGVDIVRIGGGNTYYLREIFNKSGFEDLEKFLQENEIVYVGGSAGSIVLCNDLKGYVEVDIPHTPQPIYEGLNWFPKQIIPHWGKEKYAEKHEEIREFYKRIGEDSICIKDGEAIIYNNGEYKII